MLVVCIRHDLDMVFKFVDQFVDNDPATYFPSSRELSCSRCLSFWIFQPPSRLDVRNNWFSNRIIAMWNSPLHLLCLLLPSIFSKITSPHFFLQTEYLYFIFLRAGHHGIRSPRFCNLNWKCQKCWRHAPNLLHIFNKFDKKMTLSVTRRTLYISE